MPDKSALDVVAERVKQTPNALRGINSKPPAGKEKLAPTKLPLPGGVRS